MACGRCPYCGRHIVPYIPVGDEPYRCPNSKCRRRLVVYKSKSGKLCVRRWPRVVEVRSLGKNSYKRSKPDMRKWS